MPIDDYLLREVTPDEFDRLKRQEEDIFVEAISGFDGNNETQVAFRYNSGRRMVGLFVKRDKNDDYNLVIQRGVLPSLEDTIVGQVYQTLEQRLMYLRLPEENWVDSVGENLGKRDEGCVARRDNESSEHLAVEEDDIPF